MGTKVLGYFKYMLLVMVVIGLVMFVNYIPSFHSLGLNNKITISEILDNKYNDLTSEINVSDINVSLDDLTILFGEKKGAFQLSGNSTFDDIEATFKINSNIGNDNDILAIYKLDDNNWKINGFYEIVNNSFTMETDSLGTYAIVNMNASNVKGNEIITNTEISDDLNFRDKLNINGIFTSSREIYLSRYWGSAYADNVAFINSRFTSNDTGVFDLQDKNNGKETLMYFENVVFDGFVFKFRNSGHYVFNNCTFINSPEISIASYGENIDIYVYNSVIKDNKPSLTEWNNISGDERHYKYSAISLRGHNNSLHFAKGEITNIMSMLIVAVKKEITGSKLYFEHSKVYDVAGAAISSTSEVKGRIYNNYFYNIGSIRGTNGYEAFESGVGANAVYGNKKCREMRIYKNYIKNVMENGIEGFYYSVYDNFIDNTGYRYDEGFVTPSTEGIWGGTWIIKNNIIKNVHGRGIILKGWDDGQTEVTGNIIIKGNRNVEEDYEGIRINVQDDGTSNILIKDNYISGFLEKYRLINFISTTMNNVKIYDNGYGKITSDVLKNYRGAIIYSDRQQSIDFLNSDFSQVDDNGKLVGWATSNNKSFVGLETDTGMRYGRFESSDKYGRVTQTFDLPVDTSVVCLTFKLRSSENTINVYSFSKDDEGHVYDSTDGGVYSEYKIDLTGISSEKFNDYNVCLKAKNHVTLGLNATVANQVVEFANIEAHYVIDNVTDPNIGQLDLNNVLENYYITSGTNQIYQARKNNELTFKSNGNIINFMELMIDDTTLSLENYSISLGGTNVKIKSDYLDKLTNGKHELKMIYKNGVASTKFTVTNSLYNGPSLGVRDPIITLKSNNNRVIISWDVQDDIEEYKLEYSTDNKKWKTLDISTSNSYIHEYLSYGKKYYYRVKAYKNNSWSGYSTKSITVLPNKPVLTAKNVKSNYITLTWNKVTVSGYELYRSTDKKKWVKVTSLTKNIILEYKDKSLISNKKYYYKIRAYKKVNGVKKYGKFSNIISTKTSPLSPKLSISLKNYDSIKLSINFTNGAVLYVIEKSLDGKTYLPIYELTEEGNYIDNNLVVGNKYYYRVKACNSKGYCSNWTKISKKQTTLVPKLTLSTKVNKVKVRITAVNGADGYKLYKSTCKGCEYTLLKEFTKEDELLEYIDETQSGKKYFYKVRSYKIENGNKVLSSYSNARSVISE